MKSTLLLATTLFAASYASEAQNANRTFAITGKSNNNFLWADIKEIDLATGQVSKVIFESGITRYESTAGTAQGLAARAGASTPTGLGVAACALDTRHNRLYFATMHFGDISYLDLSSKTPTFNTVSARAITAPAGYQPEENHITRMVIAADGYGYALSNDANHLLRFSTSGKTVVEDLGNLVDADANKGVSIHNKCTSWGGDMVADAFGKLVIVSANHNVFSVDPRTRVATHTGTISGLPVNFTTNGAAVDMEGGLVVSSANVLEGLYKVDVKSLAAVKMAPGGEPFNASDLANGNLLLQREADELVRFQPEKLRQPYNTDGHVYPNPVSGMQFNIALDKQPAGRYTILVTNIAGRVVLSRVVAIGKAGQVEAVRLRSKAARGMYLVKVTREDKSTAFSEKLIVQ